MPRKNKSKTEITVDIKRQHEAEDRRKIVRETIYPFLLELNDSIGFTKIFLQTASTALESTFNNQTRTQTVSDLMPLLKTLFTLGDKETKQQNEKFLRLFELLKNETVYSFFTMIQEMPRRMTEMFTHENDKRPIIDLDITKLLG